MNMYYKLKATVPTNNPRGVRKVEIEIMPDYMSFVDATYDKNDHTILVNEQGYEKGYDSLVAQELFNEIFSKAIRFEYIVFYKNNKIKLFENC